MEAKIMELSREDVLTKAMAISRRNGFDLSDEFFTEVPAEFWLRKNQDLYYSLIFDHDFAKHFWGSENYTEFFDIGEERVVDLIDNKNPLVPLIFNGEQRMQVPTWQFHLAQMALSADPLEYLRTFVENEEITNKN